MVRYGGLGWPPAVLILLGLAGYLVLYWVAYTALLSRLTGVFRAAHVLAGASLRVALEFLRTAIFTHLQILTEPHVPYPDPPTSGSHLAYIAPWGSHTEPIPKELQVHHLEDGGVLVQYHCAPGCADLVDRLRSIVGQYDRQVILGPIPPWTRRSL